MKTRFLIGLVAPLALVFSSSICNAQAPAASGSAPASAHASDGMQAPSGPKSQDTAELPVGTIEALLLDPNGNPVAGHAIKLTAFRQSIAEGDSHTERTQVSDSQGKATFSGLATTTDFSYRVTVSSGPAQFGAGTFPIRRDMGHREVITLYPVSRDQKDGPVVGRGVIAIHPAEDDFVIDVLYQIINIGKVAWVPDDLVMKLPTGWKAFTAQESPTDTHFEEAGDVGAKLMGTFGPGANEVGFRFSLTNPHEAAFGLTIPIFPRTIEMRVIVDSGTEMTLKVPGFSDATPDRMRSGQRVLVAEHNYLERREASPEAISIDIGGMRTKGNGHYIALGIALAIAAYGLWNGWQQPRSKKTKGNLPAADRGAAQGLLLDELVALEKAREDKLIGTKAYSQTRQVLLTSLARLESAGTTAPAA
ncbi:MAG TPA: hypothetical protein VL137_11485 [Polyangiaceae bacterium]|nr:hypothetical protein [Polyangiaceae bacterium]